MPTSSGTDKFRALSRVVGRQAGQSRWSRATYQGASSFWRSISRVIHALWHEVTGFFFFVFGALIAIRAYREYRVYASTGTGGRNVVLAAGLAVMFLYFAASAFRRAKRKT